MTYVVLAWVPGTTKFIVKEGDVFGYYDAGTGAFEPEDGKHFLDTAVSKHHYKRIGPYAVIGSELAQLSKDLVNW